MSATVQLSAETIACLRDEAYAHLCRQSLTQELERIEAEKQQIEATRPPFGVLASKKTRETYETSLESAIHSESELRQQLMQVERLEHWLRSMIQDSLNDYLSIVSPDHQLFNQINTLVDRWQNAVASLSEHALAFARDLRAAAATDQSRNHSLHAIASLRSTAGYLHSEAAKVGLIAQEAARLGHGRVSATSMLPALPAFRAATWVDRIIILGRAECGTELHAAEVEARAFCTSGKNDLLLQGEKTRAASLHARQAYLESYWQQLRAHALRHYVAPREVDEVIKELTEHYVAADLQRRQAELTHNPFAVER